MGLPFAPGDVIAGRFRVERVLGQGGMGAVLAAHDAELGRRVAIKVMLDDIARDPTLAERFRREAKAAVQLESQHAARVFDFGRASGVPFIVMEYLDGVDLATHLGSNGSLDPAVAVAYVRQACHALAEAHARGIAHRDVKLRNLFLTRANVVKVLDFGIAKGGDSQGADLTRTGAIVGSPKYMPPEQLRAFASADARSDVWSLGVCLYELVSKRSPFAAGSVAEIGAKVLGEPPPPLAADACPPALYAVIERCLDKDPAKRFATARDLDEALAALDLAERAPPPRAVPLHPNEDARLAALRRYGILDSAPDEDFTFLAEVAAALCEAPLAFVTFVDERRVWYKAWHGIEASAIEAARNDDYCSWTILERTLLEIPNLAEDPRTATMGPTVGEPRLRMYCGANLLTPDGLPIGTICVVDAVARSLSERQRRLLTMLARQAMSLIELRAKKAELEGTLAQVRRLAGGA